MKALLLISSRRRCLFSGYYSYTSTRRASHTHTHTHTHTFMHTHTHKELLSHSSSRKRSRPTLCLINHSGRKLRIGCPAFLKGVWFDLSRACKKPAGHVRQAFKAHSVDVDTTHTSRLISRSFPSAVIPALVCQNREKRDSV